MGPFAYIRDVFDHISTHPVNRLDELLSDNWKAAQTETPTSPADPSHPRKRADISMFAGRLLSLFVTRR
jgi:hypothetical protein